jgi:hypothetical protein
VDGLKFESDAKIADDNHLWMGTSYKINHIGFGFDGLVKIGLYENTSFRSPEKNNGHLFKGRETLWLKNKLSAVPTFLKTPKPPL